LVSKSVFDKEKKKADFFHLFLDVQNGERNMRVKSMKELAVNERNHAMMDQYLRWNRIRVQRSFSFYLF
jgi:hypothetical protein